MLCGIAMMGLNACSDFFEPENNTMLKGDDYIKEASEMYAGFLGVATKMQAIGDKAIYLTDSRAEMLIPTDRDVDMYALSNYESDLTGNTYADPAKYYDLIISCNDYLQKIYEFKQAHLYSIDMEHYKGLVASTVRVKAWVYFTMAKIYNEVVWFDDPMYEMKDYSQYPKLNLDQTIAKCVEYLKTGFDGIDGNHTMPWTEWIASDSSLSAGDYTFWDLMTPEYFALSAELALWQGRWQDVVDLVLPKMNEAFASSSTYTKWMCQSNYHNAYSKIFRGDNPYGSATVSVITYEYKKNQTNATKQNLYSAPILRPSELGIARYSDKDFNPNAFTSEDSRDGRFNSHFSQDSYGNWRMQKWSYAADNFIYIYRNVELYFMLIEAFNHLPERSEERYVLMNEGVSSYYPDGGVTYPGFTNDWTRVGGAVTHTYADTGIRGTWGASDTSKGLLCRDMKKEPGNERHNDIELLKEICLEMPCEGKTLPVMIRMAKRYNDPTIISDLVCSKYSEENAAIAAKVRAKIESGDYFVHWDIDSTSSTH